MIPPYNFLLLCVMRKRDTTLYLKCKQIHLFSFGQQYTWYILNKKNLGGGGGEDFLGKKVMHVL